MTDTSPSPASSAPSPSPSPATQGYAGDLTPAEAWQLASSGQARIVDVRTAEEWYWVGRIPGAEHIEWAIGRQQARNENFLSDLAARVPRGLRVLFLCRSGVRSQAAAKAATGAGYPSAWNITGGFEGPLDEHKQRGTRGGWRAAGLPWEQS